LLKKNFNWIGTREFPLEVHLTYNSISIRFNKFLFRFSKTVKEKRKSEHLKSKTTKLSIFQWFVFSRSLPLYQIDKIKYIDPSCNTGQGVQQICEHSSDRKLSMRREIK